MTSAARRATAVLALLASLAGLLLLNPVRARAASYSASFSGNVYPGTKVNVTGSRVNIGTVKVPTAGTYHAVLNATVTDKNPDSVQYVALSLICKEGTSMEDKIGTATNILTGESRTLQARVYFTVKDHGACYAYATTMRLRGSTATATSRRLWVHSSLTLSDSVSSRTRESKRFASDDANRDYSGHSFVARPWRYVHAGELTMTVPAGTESAQVTGNTYVTTCAFQGGSRDQTTGGKDLCTRDVYRPGWAGSKVTTRLVVRQYAPDGSVCKTTAVPGSSSSYWVRATRHHLPYALQGTVPLAGASLGCGTKLTAWTEIRITGGPAVVVHFPSTVTAVQPL